MASFEQVRDEFVVGTPDEVADKLAAYRDLGIDQVICWFMDFPGLESMRRLRTEIAPRLERAVSR